MNKLVVATLAFALATGCTEATMSSRSYLSPESSGAETGHPAADTAREVVRLAEARGYAMIDQHAVAPNGTLQLKFAKGDRAIAAQKDGDLSLNARDVGSVLYAWVVTTGPGNSAVSLLGKPTLNGDEPCTKDGVDLPCTPITSGETFVSTFMSARAEADVVHGMLSELALEGYVTGQPPANAALPPLQSDSACAKRAATLKQAESIPDLTARAVFVKTAPQCPLG